ncbi:MAG: hypothetical protein K6E29_04195 [Cyanobacteria bacterium RUI128]|nr:hypothetical protein [Cyanobacteria bacterium RUI128]
MKIAAINTVQTFRANEQAQQDKKPVKFHPFPVTAWTAPGGLGVAMVSGMMHKPLLHKISAVIGVVAAATHIGMATAHHHHHKKNINA